MKQLIWIFSFLLFMSCGDPHKYLEGHWHVWPIDNPKLDNYPLIADVEDPIFLSTNLYTLDFSNGNGYSNIQSLYLEKSNIEIERFPKKRLVLKCTPYKTLELFFKLKRDTLFLKDTSGLVQLFAVKSERKISCTRSEHQFEGVGMQIELPQLTTNNILYVDLNWENSNYLLYGNCERLKIFGSRVLCLSADNISIGLDELKIWYEGHVVPSHNRIRVFADKHRSVKDIKRLLVAFDSIPCDSIFFATRLDSTINSEIVWLNKNDLVAFVTDEQRTELIEIMNKKTYGQKCNNWPQELLTTGNNK